MSEPLSRLRFKRAKTPAPLAARRSYSGSVRIPISTWLAGIALWAGSLLLIHRWNGEAAITMVVGQLAPYSITAEEDFIAEDSFRTQLAADAAAAAVTPIFKVDTDLPRMRNAKRIFDELALAHLRLGEGISIQTAGEKLQHLLKEMNLKVEAAQLLAFIPSNQVTRARARMESVLAPLASRGIVGLSDRASSFGGKAAQGRVDLVFPNLAGEVPRTVAELLTVDEVRMEAYRALSEDIPTASNFWAELLLYLVEPTLRYEPEITRTRMEVARKQVEPVRVTYRRGTVLLEAGERVTEGDLAILKAHAMARDASKDITVFLLSWLGKGILLASILGALGGILVAMHSPLIQNAPRMWMATLICLIPLLAANALLFLGEKVSWLHSSQVQFTFPYAFTPVLLSVLTPGVLAIAAGFWVSICLAVMLGYSLPLLALGMVVTSVVVLVTKNIHRRSAVLRCALAVGIVQALYGVCTGLLNQQPAWAIPSQTVIAFVSGIISVYLTVQFVPLFESAFRITSDLRLLQLTDLSHPLLQRLSLEAPGTYHHSLMVANLAQAAAVEVGANDLLVRVAAYFHDIGKLSKPEFFIENVPYRENPHDDLAPSMSALVIISHVKEGQSMAMRYKLPQVILDGIQQHHGTTLVSYFYRRAVEQLKEREQEQDPRSTSPGVIEEEPFRYPGPKPQTIEMGILLLADTIEAASRSMQKPSPGNIERLVNDLSEDKVRDGQLDECGITFAQLAMIRHSFIFSLNNMLHPRIAYPNENRPDQQADTVSRRSGRNTGTVPVPAPEN